MRLKNHPNGQVVTKSGLVINKEVQPALNVMTPFELKMLNILTQIEQDLANLNESWKANPSKDKSKGWF
jgi:hypothetical protein